MGKQFTISNYNFDSELESEINRNHRDFVSWPLVYFLNNNKNKSAYVGETTDVIKRMRAHSKSLNKKELTSVSLILSELFNKSATLDLESNLIRYINADGQYQLKNCNLGIANHRYYQKQEYWNLFTDIWSELRTLGVARHSLEHISNSDLFKYSPYKSLSAEQVTSLKLILECLLDKGNKVSLIQGGAGTGKSILAIFLFKLLKTNLDDFNFADFDEQDEELFDLLKQVRLHYGDLEMALCIPMASFRKTISRVFKNIQGLSPNMVIGPSDLAKRKYDLVIVDEAHRLRRRVNLGPYFKPFDKICTQLGFDHSKASELDWLIKQSNKLLLFYDRNQSVKPSDVLRERFDALEQSEYTRIEVLKTQFRCKGGNEYVNLLNDVFSGKIASGSAYQSPEYECLFYDNIQDMVEAIGRKDKMDGLSRIVAGYAWEWKSKKDKLAFDIEIQNVKLRWNSLAIDWVNSVNAVNEVGCIHTTQGYDLNYTGVIIGPEIDYDFEKQKLIVIKENYKDKAGKNTITDYDVLHNFIINIYRTIMLRGMKGTFIYACNQGMRKYLKGYFRTFEAANNSVSLRILDEPNSFTIPFYDLKIAAGLFSGIQKVESLQFIELESQLKNKNDFFACKVVGESMNKIIPNGSICLFERYQHGSRNGLITLVELTDFKDSDFGSNYTVKEYRSMKVISEESFEHLEIQLLPKSTMAYEPIVLRNEETQNLRVVGIFRKVLISMD